MGGGDGGDKGVMGYFLMIWGVGGCLPSYLLIPLSWVPIEQSLTGSHLNVGAVPSPVLHLSQPASASPVLSWIVQ